MTKPSGLTLIEVEIRRKCLHNNWKTIELYVCIFSSNITSSRLFEFYHGVHYHQGPVTGEAESCVWMDQTQLSVIFEAESFAILCCFTVTFVG